MAENIKVEGKTVYITKDLTAHDESLKKLSKIWDRHARTHAEERTPKKSAKVRISKDDFDKTRDAAIVAWTQEMES